MLLLSMDCEDPLLPKTSPVQASLLPFILISLLIHALAFWGLIRLQSQAIAPMVTHKKTNMSIKARLWQAPAAVAPPSKPKGEPESAQKAEPLPEKSEPAPPQPDQPEVTDNKPAEQIKKTEIAPSNPTQDTTDAGSQAEPYNPSQYKSAAQRHLSGWHYRQQQQLAEQAASEYRQQQQNPIGEIPDYTEKLSEDEKLRQAITKEVNCEAGINSTIATVMRFAGGAVRCSKRGAFQQYIDKRLDKTQND
ncbi:hypothetical protein [Lacimicrobium alkaliphilum]|uniref:Energy transducer TonB n=1 Tax=Lacimicrobium alkaliphilum TaxID=1526571 RepID=A0ABQ1RI23_9ALTE|nr:hypothetical protein [Lacimicrobium alkaliphilum]GGD71110.1 hypothetical protein GCM10011357_27760 [Lacimicrobium alkaliphilum]